MCSNFMITTAVSGLSHDHSLLRETMFPPQEYCDVHSTSSNMRSAFPLISTALGDYDNKLNLASNDQVMFLGGAAATAAVGGDRLPILDINYSNMDHEYSLSSSYIHLQGTHQISSGIIDNGDGNGWDSSLAPWMNKAHHFHDELPESYEQFTCFPPAPDLLNLLHLPPVLPPPAKKRLAAEDADGADFRHMPLMPPSPPMFGAAGNGMLYNPPLQLNFDAGLGCSGGGSGPVFQEEEVSPAIIFGQRRGGNTVEKQRRVDMKHKFMALRSLVPNPTKDDKASIVEGAIDYIKQMQRTVEELKSLVEKKRFMSSKRKRFKSAAGNHMTNSRAISDQEGDQCCNGNGSLRSSWVLRRSKDTVVDVRIVDDEVTIKLTTQRKKINCLLLVARILHQLQLKLLQVAGGNIGDHYIFMFNTKISDDSSLYAGAIAKQVIEELDGQHLAAIPDSGFSNYMEFEVERSVE